MAKRYQSGNQNLYIKEKLTTQWPKDTKGLNQNPYIEEELTTQWPKDTSVLLRYKDSDYTFGILWPLCRLPFFDIRILNTVLVSFGHCVVSSSLIYRF
jgi:hypothetical protein